MYQLLATQCPRTEHYRSDYVFPSVHLDYTCLVVHIHFETDFSYITACPHNMYPSKLVLIPTYIIFSYCSKGVSKIPLPIVSQLPVKIKKGHLALNGPEANAINWK